MSLGGKRLGNEARLVFMFLLTASYFLVEIIVGYVSNSMALVADSFHMLSDVAALIIAFIAVLIAPKKWSKSTFGWARAEVLGALINAVFLLALCFSILVESLKRFYSLEPIENPMLVFIVGFVGLAVNVIGLLLFAGHGHGHHHHGHGHGHGHNHQPTRQVGDSSAPTVTHSSSSLRLRESRKRNSSPNAGDVPMRGANAYVLKEGADVLADLSEDQCEQEYCDEEVSDKLNEGKSEPSLLKTPQRGVIVPMGRDSVEFAPAEESEPMKKKAKSATNMNMQGVFLHILGDALGSVIVVVSAAVVQWTEWEYRFYLDPVLSIVMALIIIRSTWPLLIESGMVLLQTVPTHVDLQEIEKKLLSIEGVQGVHEFHVWRLTGDRIIASAHITFTSLADYMRIASRVKKVFHDEGIHSTTIQPEALDALNSHVTWSTDKNCAVSCPSDNNCGKNTCCPPSPSSGDRESGRSDAGTNENQTQPRRGANRTARDSQDPNTLSASLLDHDEHEPISIVTDGDNGRESIV